MNTRPSARPARREPSATAHASRGARIVGPAIEGVLVAAVGEGRCFLANAVSYVAVIVGLMLMRMTPRPKAA